MQLPDSTSTHERILLVDADELFLKILSRSLNVGGYDLHHAHSLAEADSEIRDHDFQVVVSTLTLPDGTATTLFNNLAHRSPETECIALLDGEEFLDVIRMYECENVYNHVSKPLPDIGDLARMIGRALERRALKERQAYLVTELRDAREVLKLNEEYSQGIQRGAAVGQLARDLGAQIKSPLKAIYGYADYLADRAIDASPEEAYALLERMAPILVEMRDSARNALAVADTTCQFLDNPHTERSAVNLHAVLERSILLLRHRMEERGIKLSCRLAPNLPTVYANTNQIYQAVAHLAMNAIDALPSGGNLEISTEADPMRNGSVRLTIAHSEHEQVKELNLKNLRLQKPVRSNGAAAVGMAVTRSLITDHGAEMEIASEPGGGTSVLISFPAIDTITQKAA
jgi:signal transduction histidine kinase